VSLEHRQRDRELSGETALVVVVVPSAEAPAVFGVDGRVRPELTLGRRIDAIEEGARERDCVRRSEDRERRLEDVEEVARAAAEELGRAS
jgi:hypothetical protein